MSDCQLKSHDLVVIFFRSTFLCLTIFTLAPPTMLQPSFVCALDVHVNTDCVLLKWTAKRWLGNFILLALSFSFSKKYLQFWYKFKLLTLFVTFYCYYLFFYHVQYQRCYTQPSFGKGKGKEIIFISNQECILIYTSCINQLIFFQRQKKVHLFNHSWSLEKEKKFQHVECEVNWGTKVRLPIFLSTCAPTYLYIIQKVSKNSSIKVKHQSLFVLIVEMIVGKLQRFIKIS